jgi:hypothetical protein
VRRGKRPSAHEGYASATLSCNSELFGNMT